MIILARHAKVIIDNNTIPAKDMGNFIRKYNEADIEKVLPLDFPKADIYMSSKLKRSIKSIKLLGKKADIIDQSFNEADLPYANLKLIKLPAKIWAIIFRIAWLFGYSNHSESYNDAKKRAILATDILIKHHKNNQTILLIGHGIMNRLILKVLKSRGYILNKKTGSGNWGYTILQYKP